MDVYIFVVIFTFIFCSQIKVQNGDRKAYLEKIIWCFLPIFIYGALRENFGIDYPEYKYNYELLHGNAQFIDEDDHAEIGFQWLNVMIPSWRLLVMLVSTMVISGFALLYYKYVEPRMLMLALFFTMFDPGRCFFLSFVAMRNGLVIAGFLLCTPLIVKRRYHILLPIVFLLSLLHTSALIFIPLAILAGQNFSITKKEIWLWLGASVVFSLMSVTSIINLALPLMSGELFESYRIHYMNADNHSSLLVCTANAISMFVILKWAYKQRCILTPAQNVIWRLAMLFLISPFLGVLGRTRMVYFYIPFYIITLTYLIQDGWTSKSFKNNFLFLVSAVMLYYTVFVWMGSKYFVFWHYQSIFSDL
ncbi:EpsG family protein [Prevotella sp. E9-3]|uniref:EpsG family protein n=1 Tax=Prevotella sp. E9-3 TaxID=2913621 RepID=UPI001EDA6E94|nr:EpsG family protein [Prevotella sp. E9-3]UKK47493.1 EpsG family protein [Prevotella sp. E9-3]